MKLPFKQKYLIIVSIAVLLLLVLVVGLMVVNKHPSAAKAEVAGAQSQQWSPDANNEAGIQQQETQSTTISSGWQTDAKTSPIPQPQTVSNQQTPPAQDPVLQTPPPTTPQLIPPKPSIMCLSSIDQVFLKPGETSPTYTFRASEGSVVSWHAMGENIIWSDGTTPMPSAPYWIVLPFTANQYPYIGSTLSFKVKLAPDALPQFGMGRVGASMDGTNRYCEVQINGWSAG